MLYKLTDVGELYAKYEQAESKTFQELHQLLFVDDGRANFAAQIESMNYSIAKVQKVKPLNTKHPEERDIAAHIEANI